MKITPFEEWTFEEAVSHAGEIVLECLMKGEFRDGVYRACHMITRWKEVQTPLSARGKKGKK